MTSLPTVPLAPVDAVRITILMDNVTDPLLFPAEHVERMTWLHHTSGTPDYVTFAAGSRDGRRFCVVDWNGVSRDTIRAMDKYLDDLIYRS